jgi:hypothetical protein
MLQLSIHYDDREDETYYVQQFPCRDLLASLIERAVLDLRQPHASLRLDAKRWLFSNATTPFSFRWCLHILGLTHAIHFIRLKAQGLIEEKEKGTDMSYHSGSVFELYKEEEMH